MKLESALRTIAFLPAFHLAQAQTIEDVRLTEPRESAICPKPLLASACPCLVTDPRPLSLLIDASTSVGGSAEFRQACTLHNQNARAALARLPHEIRASSHIQAFYWNRQTHSTDVTANDGQACTWASHRFTQIAAGLPEKPEPNAAIVVLTDGVEQPWPFAREATDRDKRLLCQKFREDGLKAIAGWKERHSDTTLTLLLADPQPGEACREAAIDIAACPKGASCRRVTDHELAELAGWERIIRDAMDIRQTLPKEEFSSVVLVGDHLQCMGMVVAPRAVLTAKHCLPTKRVRLIDPESVEVAVTPLAIHPTLDVALLRTTVPLAAPTPARRTRSDDAPPSGALQFFGLARTARGEPIPTARRSIDLTAAGWGCDGTRAQHYGCIEGAEFVLPGAGGTDTCGGDSGGPVFELTSTGDSCAWRAVGLVSRSTRDARAACGAGGIYTRLDAVDEWTTVNVARGKKP